MTSLCTEYWQFILAQGICSPIGIACVFYPAVTTTTSWFLRRRALAIGIVVAGSSLGGFFFPAMLPPLINRVDFPWAIRISAFIILALLIIANLTMSARIPPRRAPLVLMSLITPFAEVPFLLFAAGSFFIFLTIFVPINYITLQGQQAGMSISLSNWLLPILNAVRYVKLEDPCGRFSTELH